MIRMMMMVLLTAENVLNGTNPACIHNTQKHHAKQQQCSNNIFHAENAKAKMMMNIHTTSSTTNTNVCSSLNDLVCSKVACGMGLMIKGIIFLQSRNLQS